MDTEIASNRLTVTDVLTLYGLQDKTVPPWVISRYLNEKKLKEKSDVTADLQNPKTTDNFLFFNDLFYAC